MEGYLENLSRADSPLHRYTDRQLFPPLNANGVSRNEVRLRAMV